MLSCYQIVGLPRNGVGQEIIVLRVTANIRDVAHYRWYGLADLLQGTDQDFYILRGKAIGQMALAGHFVAQLVEESFGDEKGKATRI